jgi:glycerol-3-phosphate dehydrogenase (NAD(P)+)
MPPNVRLTRELEDLRDAEILVSALPSGVVAGFLEGFRASPEAIVSATKGFDVDRRTTIAPLWQEAFPGVPVGVLSGPNFAAEARCDKPMRTTLAFRDPAWGKELAAWLASRGFAITVTDDVLGLELCGASKNPLAIAAGAWDGLELGLSGKGALLVRAFGELRNFVDAMGAKPETVDTIGGLGDLFITCTGTQSRNYRTGYQLARGVPPEDVDLGGQVAEGVRSTPVVLDLAGECGCDLPIYRAVLDTLSGRLNREQLRELYEGLV